MMRKHPIIFLLVLVIVGFSISAGLTGRATRINHVRLTASQHHSSLSQSTHRLGELQASSTSSTTISASDVAGRSPIHAIAMARLEHALALARGRARLEQLARRPALEPRVSVARAEVRGAALRAAHLAAVARATARTQAAKEARARAEEAQAAAQARSEEAKAAAQARAEEAKAAAQARARATQAQAATTPLSQQFAELRLCESGGNYADNTGNGYYGAYQFALSTWAGLGYSGLPSQASPATQNQAAEQLQAADGWSPWPACSAALGL
jgi:flagellar biosynthesis GTPase FlhF